MKIGIAGAGAMGCKFGSRLISSGFEVCFYENSISVVNEISRNGLDVTFDNGSKQNFLLEISNYPRILNNSDIIFIFVKSFKTSEAAAQIKEFCNSETIIVSLQNGLGNYEALAEMFSPEKIVFGSTSEGASKQSHRELLYGGDGRSVIGCADSVEAASVNDILVKAGFISEVTTDPMKAVWKKAVINSAVNTLGAVLKMKNGELINNFYSRELLEMIVAESTCAASAAGVELDVGELLAETFDICRKTAANRCSMLCDIENGRQTEVDSINGYIIKTAQGAGQSADCGKTLYNLIKALEARGVS